MNPRKAVALSQLDALRRQLDDEEKKLGPGSPTQTFIAKQREMSNVHQQLIDVSFVDDPTTVDHSEVLALNAQLQRLTVEAMALARELEIPGIDNRLTDAVTDFRVYVPQNLSNSKRIIHIEPGKPLRRMTIQDHPMDITTLLEGGHREHIGLSQGLAILADDDASRKRLPFNFRFESVTIYGPAIFCRYDGSGELADLEDEDIALFEEHVSRSL